MRVAANGKQTKGRGDSDSSDEAVDEEVEQGRAPVSGSEHSSETRGDSNQADGD